MNNTLYLECNSGISGDMFVAALLDLGADPDILMNALNSLPISGFQVEISRVKKSGLDVCDFSVHLDAKHENHDHDMNYLHGTMKPEHTHEEEHHHHDHVESEHTHEEGHHHHHGHVETEHIHEEEHHHHHDHMEMGHTHEKEHHHHHGHHEHRGLYEIVAIIEQANMSDHAKQLAKQIFEIIGDAEAKAHGVSKDQVHFHEVGAVDSIVDIVAAAVCIDNLNIKDVIIPQLNEGKGWVRCQHGILSVPVPAVMNIIAAHHLPIHIMDQEGEFVTPTGAAIVAALQTSNTLPKRFTIQKIGLGAGKRTYAIPSIVRAIIIEEILEETTNKTVTNEVDAAGKEGIHASMSSTGVNHDEIYQLETNIDDCSGEALGYTMERLLELGARDVFYHPIYMKKNRPAYQLNVICEEEDAERLEQVIFAETTTIGIRKIKMKRSVLKRVIQEIPFEYGTVKIKQCELPSETRYYPEYESVAALSKKYQIPYPQMYQKILGDCREKLL